MSDADETDETAAQQAAGLRESSRVKYMIGAMRLQRGEDALALLGFHGALEDGLWAYVVGQGLSLGPLSAMLDLLRADAERPLSDEDAELLRKTNLLRNRIAHGEEIDIGRVNVASYGDLVSQVLQTYGVPVEQRPPTRASVQDKAAPQFEQPLPSASASDEYDDEEPVRARRRPQDFVPADWSEWREQALTQVQRNQRMIIPVAAGVVIFLLLCILLRGLGGGSNAGQTARPSARPTIALAGAPQDAATPPADGTSLANEQANILPTAIGGAPGAPGAVITPTTTIGIVAGGRAIIGPQGDQLNLRTQPSTGPNSSVIASLTAGTSLQILEGPTETEGHTWWRVRTDNTSEGWVVGDFLTAQAGP